MKVLTKGIILFCIAAAVTMLYGGCGNPLMKDILAPLYPAEEPDPPEDQANTYTVAFENRGRGTAPSRQTVIRGGFVTKPAALTQTGYTFGGWYREAACTSQGLPWTQANRLLFLLKRRPREPARRFAGEIRGRGAFVKRAVDGLVYFNKGIFIEIM
jgi:hypothetical protein